MGLHESIRVHFRMGELYVLLLVWSVLITGSSQQGNVTNEAKLRRLRMTCPPNHSIYVLKATYTYVCPAGSSCPAEACGFKFDSPFTVALLQRNCWERDTDRRHCSYVNMRSLHYHCWHFHRSTKFILTYKCEPDNLLDDVCQKSTNSGPRGYIYNHYGRFTFNMALARHGNMTPCYYYISATDNDDIIQVNILDFYLLNGNYLWINDTYRHLLAYGSRDHYPGRDITWRSHNSNIRVELHTVNLHIHPVNRTNPWVLLSYAVVNTDQKGSSTDDMEIDGDQDPWSNTPTELDYDTFPMDSWTSTSPMDPDATMTSFELKQSKKNNTAVWAVVPVLLILIALVVAVIIFLLIRRRRQTSKVAASGPNADAWDSSYDNPTYNVLPGPAGGAIPISQMAVNPIYNTVPPRPQVNPVPLSQKRPLPAPVVTTSPGEDGESSDSDFEDVPITTPYIIRNSLVAEGRPTSTIVAIGDPMENPSGSSQLPAYAEVKKKTKLGHSGSTVITENDLYKASD